MFRTCQDEHAKKLKALREQQDLHLAAAKQHAGSFATLVARHLDRTVRQVYDNQMEIENQSKHVKDELSRFSANTKQLGALIRQVTQMLREVGDFENYLAVVEEQTEQLAQAAQQQQQQQTPSPGEGG